MNPTATLIRKVLAAARAVPARRIRLTCDPVAPTLAPLAATMPASHAARRTLSSALAACALLGVAGPAAADWVPVTTESAADGRLVEVRVLVDDHAALLYRRALTWDRHYFQAFRGRDYALELRNTSDRRIGVLIAVDGLNVVNGERSSLSSHEPMYVLDPHETAVIRGWRTSLNDIRRFVFVDEERSYAQRTGQANGDMGWIRVLVFREDVPAWRLQDWNRVRRDDDERARRELERDQNAPVPQAEKSRLDLPAPMAAAPKSEGASGGVGEAKRARSDMALRGGAQAPSAPDAAPGTGWGEHRYDPVAEVEFHPERCATDRLDLRYEYADGLRALGIEPHRNRVWERERGELGFAKPPQW